jgi:hypothetical protein
VVSRHPRISDNRRPRVSAVVGQSQSQPPPETNDTAKKTAQPDSLDAAVEFCEGVGGVDAAKTLLEKIERIRKL